MRRVLVTLALAMLSFTAFALPSLDEVQAEVRRGNYAQAEASMREVVKDRPGSARAHYVYAEILAHNQRYDRAAQEVREARQLAPDLNFTQPDEFRAFEALLARERRTSRPLSSMWSPANAWTPALDRPLAPARDTGIPAWLWVLSGAAVLLLLWRTAAVVSRAMATPANPAGTGYRYAAAPQPPASFSNPGAAYAPASAAPSAASGMLGTGVAAAGGFAAGMLVDKLLSDGRERGMSGIGAAPGVGFLPGGYEGTSSRDEAADELEQRPIDFGSGNGWGGGDDSGDINDINDGNDGNGGGDDGW